MERGRYEPWDPLFSSNSGLQVNLPEEPGVMDFVILLLTDEFYEMISKETNLYVEQFI